MKRKSSKTQPPIDDINVKRITRLEEDMAVVTRQAFGPHPVVQALESDRRENDKRFDKIETTLKEHGEQLAEILSILKRGGP